MSWPLLVTFGGVPMVAKGGLSYGPTATPALAGTPLATIKGWGAVRTRSAVRQALARASRFARKYA
jgi:hypothetical protein